MAAFVVAPIAIVVVYAFTAKGGGATFGNFAEIVRSAPMLRTFARSFWLSLLATVVCLLIGYPMAYVLANERRGAQRVLLMLIMLPMWMNFLLRTYAWITILEKNGLLNRLLGLLGVGPLQMINTQGAVVLGMVYNFLPFMILPIYSVIVKIDRSLLEAAEDLGASPLAVFRRVIFPLSLPGVVSGITMVFVPGVSTFAISKLLGGSNSGMLGDLIEMQFQGTSYNPYLGSAVALVMMVIVMVFMYFMNRVGDGGQEAMIL
jgi:spermidine/putrescine transport system permease protein